MTEAGVAIVLWLATLAGVINCRRRAARRSTLTYDYVNPVRVKGIIGATQAFARTFEVMAWGSSLATWERRCEASLKASKRRRGLEA